MRLTHIDFFVPENRQDISEFKDRFSGFELATARSGVLQKGVALRGETALDLATATMRKLQIKQGLDLSTIDGLIFITQTQDLQLPGNTFLLLQRLGLSQNVLTYDLNQGWIAWLADSPTKYNCYHHFCCHHYLRIRYI